jgi:hypothetical protein
VPLLQALKEIRFGITAQPFQAGDASATITDASLALDKTVERNIATIPDKTLVKHRFPYCADFQAHI